MEKSEEIKIYTGARDAEKNPIYLGDLLVDISGSKNILDTFYEVVIYKDEFCITGSGRTQIMNKELNSKIETQFIKINT